MGNACGKSCGIDVFSNKLAETLVAVVTLGWVSWLGGVATPQDLEGHFVSPGARLDNRFKVNRHEVTLSNTTTINKLRLPSFSGHPTCTDVVSVGEDVHCESTTQEVHAGVPA